MEMTTIESAGFVAKGEGGPVSRTGGVGGLGRSDLNYVEEIIYR